MRRARARASKRYAARARRLDWAAIKRRRDCGDLDRVRYLAAHDGDWDTYYRGPNAPPLPVYPRHTCAVCEVASAEMEDGAFAEWSAASAHLLMRARSLGRHHLTDEEMESLALAARRSAEARR